VIPETSGRVRPSSSSPSPRPSPETHQGKIEAFLARCTVPRRGRGGDLFDLLLGRVGAGIVRVRHKIGRAAHDDAGRHLRLGEFLFLRVVKITRGEIRCAAEILSFQRARGGIFSAALTRRQGVPRSARLTSARSPGLKPAPSNTAPASVPRRDRQFESGSLQRRVSKLSVPFARQPTNGRGEVGTCGEPRRVLRFTGTSE
jgi:hypothetical protein